MNEAATQPGFGVKADDIRAYSWQAELANGPRKECYAYHEILTSKARGLSDSGDTRGTGVFRLLAAVADFFPNYEDPDRPYRPARICYQTGNRSLVPEDLTSPDLDALSSILDEIKDPEFRARVADVLWVSRKDYKAAQKAVEAYIDSSSVLEADDMWPPFTERLQRAWQIGAQLGRMKPFHQKAVHAIEDSITRHEATEDGLLCASLMKMLLIDGAGDVNRYAILAEHLAKKMEAVRNWHFARDYWQLNYGWNSKGSKTRDAQAAKLNIANTYINLAESFITTDQPSFLHASHWLGKAVHALRNAKACPLEIEKTHLRLLEFQKRGMSEMQTIQIPLERSSELDNCLGESAKYAAEHVKARSFEDAILRLAFVATPTDPDELKKRIEDPNYGGAFTQIFGSTTVRTNGQISDTKPPLASADPKDHAKAVLKEMFSQARSIDWKMKVKVCIDPARQQIIAEHPSRLVDLLFLVQDNPFVPLGRERLFLRGLHAGLLGDLVLALHLLLPQIENSLREIFTANRVITSKLESDNSQDEYDLGWILNHAEMAKIFGGGMAFDLRGLLVERFGLNLRNEIAHGLLTESQMITEGALYAWWLTLRLCCIPIAVARKE
jgi:hypothetical protein